MHPRVAEVFGHLARARAELDAAIASVPRTAHRAKPSPDRWSVAEIVEHLADVEHRIATMLAKLIADAKASGLAREGSSAPLLDQIDTKRVLDRTKRIVSTTIPSGTLDGDQALRQLAAAREELKSAVMQGDGFDLSAITAPHRAFGQLTVYEWVAFVGSHMERHAAQVRELSS